jgi:hypothetical protein
MSPAATVDPNTAKVSNVPLLSCHEVQIENFAYEGDMVKPFWDKLEEATQSAWLEGTSQYALQEEDFHRVVLNRWETIYAEANPAASTHHANSHVGTDGKMVSVLPCLLGLIRRLTDAQTSQKTTFAASQTSVTSLRLGRKNIWERTSWRGLPELGRHSKGTFRD